MKGAKKYEYTIKQVFVKTCNEKSNKIKHVKTSKS